MLIRRGLSMQTDQLMSLVLQMIADHAIEEQVNAKETMRNSHLIGRRGL